MGRLRTKDAAENGVRSWLSNSVRIFVESTSEEQVGKAQPEMRVWSVRGRDGGQ